MRVVQIAGRKSSGKTFLSDLLFHSFSKEGYRIYKISFASKLKFTLRKLGVSKSGIVKNLSFEDFYSSLQDIFFTYFPKYIRSRLITQTIKYFYELRDAYNIFFIQKDFENGFRKLAQLIGTEIVREIDEDFWVKEVVRSIKQVEKCVDFVLIDDWRFPNEDLTKYFPERKVFRILLVTKDEQKDNHISENLVNQLRVDLKVERYGDKYNPDFEKIIRRVRGEEYT